MRDSQDLRSVSFRFATLTDVSDLLALWELAAENGNRPVGHQFKVQRLIERDPEALDVAVLDGRTVASLISGWDGWRAHLYRLAVHPDARRCGIGRHLLLRAQDRLVSLGATRIDAMVLEGNELGQTIWSAMGYESQQEWRRWVLPVQ